MVVPLIPVALAALGALGLGVSAGSNLYRQSLQRNLYGSQANAYKNLHEGYSKYLAKHGRQINPDRAWASYYGQYQSALNKIESSTAESVGTIGGTLGATSGLGYGLYRNLGKTSKRA